MKSDFKDDDRDSQQRLLADIFAEDFGPSKDAGSEMNLLLREVRLAHWRRKTRRVLLAAAAVFAVGILTALYTRDNSRQISSLSPAGSAHLAPRTPSTDRAEFISDEQLLSLFPPGSCFLAELDGKQVLVFKDPSLAASLLE
jgi:hypothetical protein